MKNPWLDIPLTDLEGHMALPHVAQALLLSDVFASALKKFSPQSVAIIGCSGGNGFERISPLVTRRVVGVDINPDYIRETQRRFKDSLPGLELFAGDIQTDDFNFLPVDLVYAGLLFEYVEIDTVLPKIHSKLSPIGRLVTVVQLPSKTISEITPSPFAGIQKLSSVMHLVPPELLESKAIVHGFKQTEKHIEESMGGKQFMVQTFH
jgi:SAM-dependent methyltransferase